MDTSALFALYQFSKGLAPPVITRDTVVDVLVSCWLSSLYGFNFSDEIIKISWILNLFCDSSSRAWHRQEPGPASMSSTELTWRCCPWSPSRWVLACHWVTQSTCKFGGGMCKWCDSVCLAVPFCKYFNSDQARQEGKQKRDYSLCLFLYPHPVFDEAVHISREAVL